MDGRKITDALEAVLDACTAISEAGTCSRCPMFNACINDTTFAEVVDWGHSELFNDMIDLADHGAENDGSYDDDLYRQMDIEERDIDERWGI